MVWLIAVIHQAVVAGSFAVLACAGGTAQVLPGVRVEMAQPQRFTSDLTKGLRVVKQSPQDAGTTFRRFVNKQQPAIINTRQRFGSQLVVFQLKLHLDGPLESRLQ